MRADDDDDAASNGSITPPPAKNNMARIVNQCYPPRNPILFLAKYAQNAKSK